MPFYPDEPAGQIDLENATTEAKTSSSDRTFASQYSAGLSRTPGSFVPALAIGSTVDLADTVMSSIIPGVQRQDVNNKFLEAIGSPGLTGWFDQNKGAVELGSGVVGTLLADTVAKRILAPAAVTMRLAREIPFVKTIATLDKQYESASRIAMLTQAEVAKRGLTGVDRFLGGDLVLSALGREGLVTSRAQASKNLFMAAGAKGLARNATTEGIMATALHTNSFLYGDDLTHNLAWSVAGLGIGAGIDSMITSYTLRKMANSQQVRRLNAAAYDPSGYEAQRLHAFDVADKVLKEAGADPKDLGFMFQAGGGVTDTVSSLAAHSSELAKAPVNFTDRARTLFGKREPMATHSLDMAFDEMNKVTVRGLRGVSRAGFHMQSEGLGTVIRESLRREPLSMHGIEEIGTTVEDLTAKQTVELRGRNLKQRFDMVQDLLSNNGKWTRRRVKGPDGEAFEDRLVPLKEGERDALLNEAKELHFASSHVPVAMLEPGEWSPISHASILDTYQPRRIIPEGDLSEGGRKIWARERLDKNEPHLGLASDGELFLPGNGKLESLKIEDMLHLFHAGNRAVRDMAAAGTTLKLPAKPNWFQLDLAEQLLKATDNSAAVQFPGKMTRQSALTESFAQKVDAINRRGAILSRMKTMPDEGEIFQNKVFFNLPRLSPYQAGLLGTSETPIDVLLHGFTSADQVRAMPADELLKGVNDARQIKGMTESFSNELDSLQGNSFNFLMDRDGNAIKPIVGYKRPFSPVEWSRDDLLVRQTMKEAWLRDSLMGDSADPITKEIVATLMSDPAASEARKVNELADDQHRSFVPGARNAAPQTKIGSFVNSVTSRERRDIDSLTMKAASQVQELKSRITQAVMKEVVTNHMGDTITLMNTPRNVKSLALMNQFLTFRQGWELVKKPTEVQLPNGGKAFAFVLDHESALNQRRFEQMFGNKLQAGQQMLNPQGAPMVLDELSMRTLNSMQAVHQTTLDMKNTALRSQGLPQIKEVPFYAPPPSTKGKYLAYTFDNNNNVVPGMTVIADSPDELTRMKSELLKSPQWREGYRLRQRDDVTDFMTLWDKAQMDFIDPGTTAIQPKKHNYGRTGGNLLNTQAFSEALVSMRDNMVSHGDDLIDILYDDVLKSAKSRSHIAKVESQVGGKPAAQHSSIYDRFTQNLTGKSSLGAKDSFFGDAFTWLEDRVNGFLASDPAMRAGAAVGVFNDYIRAATPGVVGLPKEKFEKLSQELGKYMPYQSVTHMIERETGSRTPKEVADITSKLSWFEAASRLRWFESMHAVANIGSVVANMPAIVRALQPKLGESATDAALRNSSLTMLMNVGKNGEQVVLPNSAKLLWESSRDAFKKVPDEFTKKAIRMGFMDQEVAEFQRQWGAIDSKDGWHGFMFGNTAKEGKGLGAKITRTGGLDKWLGLLSDKSEAFSRQWGMYAGKRVAEAMGIHDVDAQVNFAHEMTNKLIANYDPRNRPEIFQGALGAPLGLFQSYIYNFYNRMFRYIETGDKRSLATQYAMQTAVWGGASNPGWQALNWAFFDQGQATGDDPVESMYKRFGAADADLLMHGTISNLPKLFGLDGVSLYTRGDAQFRLPVNPFAANTFNIPVADTVRRVWGGISQAIGTFKEENGHIGLNHIAEIASNVITNRPLAGFIETFGAHGFDTTQDGQVAAMSHNAAESTYRVLGVRSMQQQNEIEQFYASKNAQEEQGARKDLLTGASRAAIRDGRFDDLPGIFSQYVEEGGDPRYYTKWLKSSLDAATHTRGERMLEKALKNPNNSKNAYIGRLLDAQVGVDEDEQDTDDYGRQQQIDNLIQQGWQATPNPTGNPMGDSLSEADLP